MKGRTSLRKVFALPLAIAVLSATGLVAALAGDGWHDVVSWIGLGTPVLVVAWAIMRRRS